MSTFFTEYLSSKTINRRRQKMSHNNFDSKGMVVSISSEKEKRLKNILCVLINASKMPFQLSYNVTFGPTFTTMIEVHFSGY